MILVICAGGVILLENPGNSVVATHARFVWLVRLLESHNIPVFWPEAHIIEIVARSLSTDLQLSVSHACTRTRIPGFQDRFLDA